MIYHQKLVCWSYGEEYSALGAGDRRCWTCSFPWDLICGKIWKAKEVAAVNDADGCMLRVPRGKNRIIDIEMVMGEVVKGN